MREVAPEVLPPRPWKRVDMIRLNVTLDARFAAQARKLSGAHTVPQVCVFEIFGSFSFTVGVDSPVPGCLTVWLLMAFLFVSVGRRCFSIPRTWVARWTYWLLSAQVC
jgi:hypothetical protein